LETADLIVSLVSEAEALGFVRRVLQVTGPEALAS
jgi:hypothetical protein